MIVINVIRVLASRMLGYVVRRSNHHVHLNWRADSSDHPACLDLLKRIGGTDLQKNHALAQTEYHCFGTA